MMPCWLHTWRTLRREALREWTSWLGTGAILGGAAVIFLADSATLGEWAARIGIVSPIVGTALIWLRQQRPERRR